MKVTSNVQLAPGAMLAPQELVCWKMRRGRMRILRIRIGWLVALTKVMGWGALVVPTGTMPKSSRRGKTREGVDERMTTGPVKPVRLIKWGLPGALSAIAIFPVLVPGPAGVKVIAIEHVAPAGRGAPQSLV